MRLALAADVMNELGFDNMVNIARATTNALDYATIALAGALETSFDTQKVIDTWYVKEPQMTQRWGNFSTEFKLSQGMLSSQPGSPKVLIASQAYAFNDPTGQQYTDNTTAVTIQMERGVAVDIITAYFQLWVQMSYYTGYPVPAAGTLISDTVESQAYNLSQGNPPLVYDGFTYDLLFVPQWLQSAAKLHAKISLQSNPSLEDPAIKMDTKLLQSMLAAIMKPRSRYAPSALLPVNSAAISGATILATADTPPIDPVSETTLLYMPLDETDI